MAKHDDIPQVAILVSTSSSWGRRIVKGILSYANEVGPWHIWVKEADAQSITELPKGWRGDGIIGRIAKQGLADEISKSGLPVVNVADTALKGFTSPCVRTDDAAGARMAVEHFVDRGLSHLAFAGPLHMPNPEWYHQAYKNVMDEHGLKHHFFAMSEDDHTDRASLTRWLHDLPKPVGIMVWGNGYARQVVDACMEEGISVPHDVAVLSGGYDDLLSHACFPALSGILAPTEQIGYRAAELLHKMIQGSKVPHDTTFLPPLGIMERLSTDTLAVEDPQLVQVVEYIRAHAFEPITMDNILVAVPMARRSLERRFHQAFGRTPVDEIRRIRIDKARKLLAETDLPMQEIAEACGYATYNYLTHVFKKVTGLPPRDYRKQFRA